MPTTSDILARNNVRISGRGRQPMLFAHGFGCDQSLWKLVTPAFEATHQVIVFDYVGSGDSDRLAYDPVRYNTLDGYTRDVLDICEALSLRDVVFVGHSVSSMIGMLAAIAQPERFSHLLMVAPSPCYTNEPPDYIGGFEHSDIASLLSMMDHNGLDWASFLAPNVMQNPERPELTDALHDTFCKTDPIIVRQFAEVTFCTDLRHRLHECRTPSLILQCSDDAIAPVEVGRHLQRHLPGSTLQQMTATGHCPHVSHPAETVAHMQAYLRR
ncbi:MAG: alpha/beta hydrolase [Aquabacterium sp.]